jgi:release factor glutamine methyltransferase
MMVRDWIGAAASRLTSLEVESPTLEAQMLAAHVLRVDRTWLFAHPEADFPTLAGDALLERRATGEPLAYILGWREFYGRKFGVDRSVLIPRQETETLIEAALGYFDRQVNPVDVLEPTVLDLGTGSGILAITLKIERPDWHVTGSDLSSEALSTASANAKFHHADVKFVLGDGFEGLLGESFDLIVSNPPYVGREEALPTEVARFEPEMALYADSGGLAFYEMLSDKAFNYLTDGGVLFLEVGYRQAAPVTDLFIKKGWRRVEEVRDLSGVLRVLAFQYDFDCS